MSSIKKNKERLDRIEILKNMIIDVKNDMKRLDVMNNQWPKMIV